MSYLCTENAYGSYPGENDYEEGLERYELEQFKNELNKEKYYDNDNNIPWYVMAYRKFRYSKNDEEFIVPIKINSNYMREKLTSYLRINDKFSVITLQKNTAIFVDNKEIKQINNFSNCERLRIHNKCSSIDDFIDNSSKVYILDIYKDADIQYIEKLTRLMKEKNYRICFLRSE